MIDLRKYFRLLPAIVVIGACLLAIKGVDLARAQQASAFAAPDIGGLAPPESGDGKPTNDLAADDGPTASAAEVDVLSSLTHRRAELDARERALNTRENLLAASEGRVDQKIASLKSLQNQIQALLSQRDAAQDKQIASLVKTYSAMKAKDAAHIFDTLADEVLLPVAKGMKSDVLAPVLGAMNREAAQQLTVKLAALLKLPETPADCAMTHAMMPETAGTAAPLIPATAAAIPPPASPALQTAAIAAPQPVPPSQTTPATPTPAATAAPAQAAAAPPLKSRKPAPQKSARLAVGAVPQPAAETNVPTTKSELDSAATSAPPAPPRTAPASAATTPPAPIMATPGADGPPAALTPTAARGG